MKVRKNYGWPPRYKDLRVELSREGHWMVVGYDVLMKEEYPLITYSAHEGSHSYFGKMLADILVTKLTASRRRMP